MEYARKTGLPPTPKQVDYARHIAARLNMKIPGTSIADRKALSDWIGENQALIKAKRPKSGVGASSRQVAYAEKIARRKRVAVPEECFKDAGLMSRWIEHNAGTRRSVA